MDRLSFTSYCKIAPTIARVLTRHDYEAWHGIVDTPEGPRAFLPGDYLAKDAKGQWPIQADKIRSAYRAAGPADEQGFVAYYALDPVQAVQMPEAFTVDGLTGKAGDYLVQRGESRWPVDRELFEQTYRAITRSADEEK